MLLLEHAGKPRDIMPAVCPITRRCGNLHLKMHHNPKLGLLSEMKNIVTGVAWPIEYYFRGSFIMMLEMYHEALLF